MNSYFLFTTVYKSMISAPRLITTAFLRHGLSYSSPDSNFKYKVNRTLTFGSVPTFIAKVKKVVKISETRD